MSFVIATPDLVESAASELAGIRSSLAEATSTAAFPTTGIASAAQDEVSLAVASLFGNVGQEFQALSARAQVFHAQFVEMMNAGAGAYAAAETVNAGQTLLSGGIVGNIGGTLGGSLGGVEAAVGQFGASIVADLNGAVGAVQADISAVSSAILGAPASVTGALQTGAQGVSQAVTGFGNQFQALATGGVPGLVTSANVFANQIAGPYEALVNNTVANLQSIGNTFMANPFPFAHQLITNQIGYAQTIATAIGNGLVNLPTELANLPATIQAAVQGLLSFNPVPYLQGFINNTITYTQTIVTGLTQAVLDLGTGFAGLPAAFQTAAQDLMAGNFQGALDAIGSGLQGIVLPGFGPLSVPLADFGVVSAEFPIIPTGSLGDLLPVLAIPGQLAQDFTNLLPAGTIPAQISQNFTNVLSTLTNFGSTLNSQDLAITFGLPLQLVFDGIGAPVNAFSAIESSAAAFGGALQAGNVSGAIAAVLDAPAVLANGVLNGQTLVALPPLTVDLTGAGSFPPITQTAQLPLGGLLTPLSSLELTGGGGPLPGTPIGGIIPALQYWQSLLAADITP
ncbi:PE family protein [Mycobacterium servetii]|uniref:PE family protein n=1 Tax=Mycobacterium servetii TaxID=3237418 RepID=A0ABV4C6W6_9MYCO